MQWHGSDFCLGFYSSPVGAFMYRHWILTCFQRTSCGEPTRLHKVSAAAHSDLTFTVQVCIGFLEPARHLHFSLLQFSLGCICNNALWFYKISKFVKCLTPIMVTSFCLAASPCTVQSSSSSSSPCLVGVLSVPSKGQEHCGVKWLCQWHGRALRLVSW